MTILGILLLFSLLQTYATLDVVTPSPQRALVTNDAVLTCTFSVDIQPLDLKFLAVSWSFQGKVILRYDNKGFSSQDPRMSLSVESLMEGHASLHISNVTISDGGIYKCFVGYSAESKEKQMFFRVFARPLLSIHGTKVQRNTENTLTCKASGFFPPDVLITWYRDEEVLSNQVMGQPQMYNDGTYQAYSTVTITPTDHDQNQIFSCRVQHDSLQEPLQRDFQLINEDKEASSNVVMVVGIILILIAIVGIGIFILYRKLRKKGGRGKGAEPEEDQNRKLVSSGDVRQPPDSIININEEFTRNQQHGPPEEDSSSQMTGTNPATTLESSDSAVYSSGKVRQTRHSINNANKTSIRNPQPETREEPNHSQMTNTRSAVHRKSSDTAVYSRGGRRSDEEAENQDNENKKLISGDKSGDVRQPPDSIYNTNETSIRNPKPEPREEPNHSQKTGTRSVIPPNPPDPTAYRPGNVWGTRDSIRNTNKRFTRNQQPEPREEPYHSQKTGTRSVVPPKPSDTTVYTPGDASLVNQRPERHQTMPEDRKTKPSANSQEAEVDCSAATIKILKTMFQN